MTTMTAKLTPHQQEVFDRIAKQAARTGGAISTYIGSDGACRKLEEKGLITMQVRRGPRGGVEAYLYRLTEQGEQAAGVRTLDPRNARRSNAPVLRTRDEGGQGL